MESGLRVERRWCHEQVRWQYAANTARVRSMPQNYSRTEMLVSAHIWSHPCSYIAQPGGMMDKTKDRDAFEHFLLAAPPLPLIICTAVTEKILSQRTFW
jgi:hypothetical protein